jgi:hypothetical protein
MLGEARRPSAVDDQIIAHCESFLDAVRLCIHLSNFSHLHICETLGIDKGHWARMMQGRAHFPPNKVQPLMELCGNLAPLQYLMAQNGLRIPVRKVGMRDAEAA